MPVYAYASIISGPRCADGYRWWEVGYKGLDGWSAEVGPDGLYNLIPNTMPMHGQSETAGSSGAVIPTPFPSAAPEPTSQPGQALGNQSESEASQGDQPSQLGTYGCGGLSGEPSLVERVAAFFNIEVQAREMFDDDTQCVFYAASRRSDALQWLRPSGANADVWPDDASKAGLWVSSPTDEGFSLSLLHYNDLVVWRSSCGGPYSGTGHVAVIDAVSLSGNKILTQEVNGLIAETRTSRTVHLSEIEKYESCMRFIHNPGESQPIPTSGETLQSPGPKNWWQHLSCVLWVGRLFGMACPS